MVFLKYASTTWVALDWEARLSEEISDWKETTSAVALLSFIAKLQFQARILLHLVQKISYNERLFSVELCPHLDTCLADKKSDHEDTEIGRCVFKHLKIQCGTNMNNEVYTNDLRSNILAY